MTTDYAYIVVARYFDEESSKYVGTIKEFNSHPDNPILDREAAFAFRDEVILGLLEVLPIKKRNFKDLSEIEKRDLLCHYYFKNDESANWEENFNTEMKIKMEHLPFYSDNKELSYKIKNDSIGFYPLFSDGIWVMLQHNDKEYFDPFSDDNDEDKNRLLIDKIISKGKYFKNHIPPLMEHLESELGFYEAHNYSTIGDKGQYKTEVSFFDFEMFAEGGDWDLPNTYKILKTPFDWSGYDEAFWWREPSSQNDWEYLDWIKENKEWNEKMPTPEDIFATSGENQYKEFKPALHYNVKTKKGSLGQMHRNAKAICAFLNSGGGYLFIGINDDGTIQGLKNDFDLVNIHGRNGQDPEEYFINKFSELMTKFFDKSVAPLVIGNLIKDEKNKDDVGLTCFRVAVQPSPDPVFLKKEIYDKETGETTVEKEFYYRYNASSQSIQDPESILNYCKNNWKWK